MVEHEIHEQAMSYPHFFEMKQIAIKQVAFAWSSSGARLAFVCERTDTYSLIIIDGSSGLVLHELDVCSREWIQRFIVVWNSSGTKLGVGHDTAVSIVDAGSGTVEHSVEVSARFFFREKSSSVGWSRLARTHFLARRHVGRVGDVGSGGHFFCIPLHT